MSIFELLWMRISSQVHAIFHMFSKHFALFHIRAQMYHFVINIKIVRSILLSNSFKNAFLVKFIFLWLWTVPLWFHVSPINRNTTNYVFYVFVFFCNSIFSYFQMNLKFIETFAYLLHNFWILVKKKIQNLSVMIQGCTLSAKDC